MTTKPPPSTILVIDDDDAIVDALTLLLEFSGYHPQVMDENGNVVDEAALTQPSAILLDVWLSGRDGREVCRELKRDQRTSHIPVILISASRELAASATAAGADSYIEKPFEMDTVIQRLSEIVPSPAQ